MSDRTADFHALYRELRIRRQLAFYRERRDEYREAHRQAVLTRNALLVLSALGGLAGQFVGDATRGGIAIGSATLGGLAVAVTGYESLIGFAQLSKLFDDAAVNLERAEIAWDKADPRTDLRAQLAGVEGIFTRENGQWGQLVTDTTRSLSGPSTDGPRPGSPYSSAGGTSPGS